ncbi:MAG: YqgE/AlgH family protein [Gammaproteobacteria bacterium]|nr:YqgE/AlgH family protein [Gammaproteobacteria bacterium]
MATRTQQGFFAQSVILLIAYGPDGAVGIVVNHPTKVALAEVLPDHDLLRGRHDLLYLGGPVSLDDLTMLIRSHSAPAKSIRVFTGVYASASSTTLRSAIDQKLTSASFRTYAGYAGWAPGQLDSELEQGAWIVVRADADEVFATAPEKLWDKLIPQGDVILVQAAPLDSSFQSRRYSQIPSLAMD